MENEPNTSNNNEESGEEIKEIEKNRQEFEKELKSGGARHRDEEGKFAKKEKGDGTLNRLHVTGNQLEEFQEENKNRKRDESSLENNSENNTPSVEEQDRQSEKIEKVQDGGNDSPEELLEETDMPTTLEAGMKRHGLSDVEGSETPKIDGWKELRDEIKKLEKEYIEKGYPKEIEEKILEKEEQLRILEIDETLKEKDEFLRKAERTEELNRLQLEGSYRQISESETLNQIEEERAKKRTEEERVKLEEEKQGLKEKARYRQIEKEIESKRDEIRNVVGEERAEKETSLEKIIKEKQEIESRLKKLEYQKQLEELDDVLLKGFENQEIRERITEKKKEVELKLKKNDYIDQLTEIEEKILEEDDLTQKEHLKDEEAQIKDRISEIGSYLSITKEIDSFKKRLMTVRRDNQIERIISKTEERKKDYFYQIKLTKYRENLNAQTDQNEISNLDE